MAKPQPVEGSPVEAPRQLARRLVTANLTGEYEGWWYEFDQDFTIGDLEDFSSQRYLRIRNAMSRVVTRWNFVDKDGVLIPFPEEVVTIVDNDTPGKPSQTVKTMSKLKPFDRVSKSLLAAMVNDGIFADLEVPEASRPNGSGSSTPTES